MFTSAACARALESTASCISKRFSAWVTGFSRTRRRRRLRPGPPSWRWAPLPHLLPGAGKCLKTRHTEFSVGALGEQDRAHGPGQDTEIQPQGPVPDIVGIEG